MRATSIRFGTAEVLPADVAAIDAYADGTDQSIVDSGTSGLVLPQRAFDAAVATLSAAAPDVPSAFWRGEACVDASKLDVSALPELTVSLATEGDDVVLTMPACRYVNRVPKTSYCAAVAPCVESSFEREAPSTRCCLCSCACSMAWNFTPTT